ncbi:MAG TPA: hypothetical protein VKK79_03465, partial [Candidatus Lokiarchaeia archaeon]|nr:hypothetical protein [Candidatus Lokiarchaeia archaeon]
MVLIRSYKQDNHFHILLLMYFWGFLCWWVVNEILQIIFVGLQLYDAFQLCFHLSFFPFVLFTISITFFVDVTSRDSIDTKKLVMLTAGVTTVILLTFIPDTNYWVLGPNGGPILDATGFGSIRITSLLLAFIALTIFLVCILIYHLVKINQEAPPNLKKYSRIGLVGGLISGILTPIAIILGLAGV